MSGQIEYLLFFVKKKYPQNLSPSVHAKQAISTIGIAM
jgi:hypothetical protein